METSSQVVTWSMWIGWIGICGFYCAVVGVLGWLVGLLMVIGDVGIWMLGWDFYNTGSNSLLRFK